MSTPTQIDKEQALVQEAEPLAAETKKAEQKAQEGSGDELKKASRESLGWGYCIDTSGGPLPLLGF